MQIPATTSFINIDPSDALKNRIDQKISRLNQKYQNVVGCHIFVEAINLSQQKGRLYTVRIDVTLPGGNLVVSNHPGKNPRKHDKIFAAMNSAFVAIDKQLAKFKDLRNNDTKTHKPHFQEAVVSNYFQDDGYGFMSTIDGSEIYFHENAVENQRFSQLDIGSKVRFVLAANEGLKGPQASIVVV